MMTRAVLGMFLMIAGGAIHGVGKRGFRGGGGSRESFGTDEASVSPIKVRCTKCRQLNDEHDRFCSQCGTKL